MEKGHYLTLSPVSTGANCAVFLVKVIWRFKVLNQSEAEGGLVGNLENKETLS